MAHGSQINTIEDETAHQSAKSPTSEGAGTVRTNCVFGHNTVPGTLQRNRMQGCFGRTRIERSACSGGEFFRRKCASTPSGNSILTCKAASSRSGITGLTRKSITTSSGSIGLTRKATPPSSGSTSLTRKATSLSSGSTGLRPIAGHPSLKSAIFRQKPVF